MAKSEALDGVKKDRPFAGVHIIATAMLCAAGSSDAELELARRLLERDPKTAAPRERESVAGAFNRHMDAAIDSVNDSVGEPTRAGRRARLAHDLDQADLVLMDRAMVAALMVKLGELKDELASKALWTDGYKFFTGKSGTIPIDLPAGRCAHFDSCPQFEDADDEREDQDHDLGAELLADEAVLHGSSIEFVNDGSGPYRGLEIDPGVND